MTLFARKERPTDEALPDALWGNARDLVRRGPPYVPAEALALGAAAALAYDRPILDGLDVLVVTTSARFPRPPADAGPERPTPFDDAIATAEAELAEVTDRELAARTEYQRRVATARACATRPADWEAAMAEAESALDAHRHADHDYLRVRSRLVALGLNRDRWLAGRTE